MFFVLRRPVGHSSGRSSSSGARSNRRSNSNGTDSGRESSSSRCQRKPNPHKRNSLTVGGGNCVPSRRNSVQFKGDGSPGGKANLETRNRRRGSRSSGGSNSRSSNGKGSSNSTGYCSSG